MNVVRINLLLLAGLCLFAAATNAAEVPVVGLWEKYPVSTETLKLVARPQYVFTNAKLTVPTIFTGLNSSGGDISTLCCIVVKNITPLQVADVVKKYAMDLDFGTQMKSIKGLGFMYEAVAADASLRNEFFRTIMATDLNPDDISPFSAAVIGVRLAEKDAVRNSFKVGPDTVSLKVTYPNDKMTTRYQFKINGRVVEFQEDAQAH